jgi:hypothetical protein
MNKWDDKWKSESIESKRKRGLIIIMYIILSISSMIAFAALLGASPSSP